MSESKKERQNEREGVLDGGIGKESMCERACERERDIKRKGYCNDDSFNDFNQMLDF